MDRLKIVNTNGLTPAQVRALLVLFPKLRQVRDPDVAGLTTVVGPTSEYRHEAQTAVDVRNRAHWAQKVS
jgi:hypothetical protein